MYLGLSLKIKPNMHNRTEAMNTFARLCEPESQNVSKNHSCTIMCIIFSMRNDRNGVKPLEAFGKHLYKTRIAAGVKTGSFWHGGEQEDWCEHGGLVSDCEIAVCQGKTRGQLWAIAARVGRDSWKEAPSTDLREAELRALSSLPDCPAVQFIWPFDLNAAPPLSPLSPSFTHLWNPS